MTNENYSKYRLVVGAELMVQFSPELIKMLIEEWVKESGVKEHPAGRIKATLDPNIQAVVYEAYYDSSCWTGRE